MGQYQKVEQLMAAWIEQGGCDYGSPLLSMDVQGYYFEIGFVSVTLLIVDGKLMEQICCLCYGRWDTTANAWMNSKAILKMMK
jgi:hypothetical protein